MLETIIQLISDVTYIKEEYANIIQFSTHLKRDLALDSLDMVDLSIAVEDMFNIEIPDEDFESWVTVGDIAKTIEKYS